MTPEQKLIAELKEWLNMKNDIDSIEMKCAYINCLSKIAELEEKYKND